MRHNKLELDLQVLCFCSYGNDNSLQATGTNMGFKWTLHEAIATSDYHTKHYGSSQLEELL